MKYWFILFLICYTTVANAQVDSGQIVGTPTEEDVVFVVAEKAAEFPGGLRAWSLYLQKNLNANLALECIKLKKKQKSASQTIMVRFVVDKDGSISDVGVVNGNKVHPTLAAEAMRVIQTGPKWNPAMQKGRYVKYRAIQPITFVVSED